MNEFIELMTPLGIIGVVGVVAICFIAWMYERDK